MKFLPILEFNPGYHCACLTGMLLLLASTCRGELSLEPSWELPAYEQAREQVLAWVEQAELGETKQAAAQALWPRADLRHASGSALLERAADTFALADSRVEKLVAACNTAYQGPLPPDASWLELDGDDAVPALVRNNMRLYYARWLAQHQLYDEVVSTLKGLRPTEVLDPSGLLFYRMVAHQQLVEPEMSRTALAQLLERDAELPQRYRQVANLLRRDLSGLKDESLDHIARRMKDVCRRLDIGRAGKQVQLVEQGVVDSLDRVIKKLEEQANNSQAQSQGGAQSSQPMEDSRLPAMRAPMQVDRRDIGSQSGWGDLPAKQREEALQQIGREFPAHYRELIEQYFRDLAEQAESNPSN